MRFKLIITATRTDLSERVTLAAKQAGATGATVLPARGTGTGEARTFFGLSLDVQRDVILFLVKRSKVSDVMKAVHKEGKFDTPGTGIAFALNVDEVTGMKGMKG